MRLEDHPLFQQSEYVKTRNLEAEAKRFRQSTLTSMNLREKLMQRLGKFNRLTLPGSQQSRQLASDRATSHGFTNRYRSTQSSLAYQERQTPELGNKRKLRKGAARRDSDHADSVLGIQRELAQTQSQACELKAAALKGKRNTALYRSALGPITAAAGFGAADPTSKRQSLMSPLADYAQRLSTDDYSTQDWQQFKERRFTHQNTAKTVGPRQKQNLDRQRGRYASVLKGKDNLRLTNDSPASEVKMINFQGGRSHSINSHQFGNDRPELKVYVPNSSNAFFASGFKMVDANQG